MHCALLAILCAEGAVVLPDGNMNMELEAGAKHTKQNLKSRYLIWFGSVYITSKGRLSAPPTLEHDI